jgi:hypothetical protein
MGFFAFNVFAIGLIQLEVSSIGAGVEIGHFAINGGMTAPSSSACPIFSP